jgi:hypothetical protein
MNTAPRIPCRTPTAGRDGVTHIPAWKFDLLREAVLRVLEDGPVAFKELKERVRPLISDDDLAQLGSLGWHLTSVKLELEVRGEIMRVPDLKPQHLQLRPN